MNKTKVATLIAVMRKLADNLNDYSNEDNWHFEWLDTNYCTVGMLAKKLLDEEYYELHEKDHALKEQLKDRSTLNWGMWSAKAQVYCEATQLPLSLIIQKLYDYGLQYVDIVTLEYGGQAVREKYEQATFGEKEVIVEDNTLQFAHPGDAVHLLRKVADTIERRYAYLFQGVPVAKILEQPVTVGVGHAT